jgi:hypothetical protein
MDDAGVVLDEEVRLSRRMFQMWIATRISPLGGVIATKL